jgi:hypothetical protein
MYSLQPSSNPSAHHLAAMRQQQKTQHPRNQSKLTPREHMTTATTRNTSKAERRPTCPHCSKRFRTRSAVKKFCTVECQKEATKLKRRISYEYRATNSAFFYHLASEAERAGTLQIFQGHDVDSLVALYNVYKFWLRANRYGDDKLYDISHICPVRGITVGLYHASNLVVAPSVMNRAHRTKSYGHGLSIPRTDLKQRYDVAKGCNRKDLIKRIISYLGMDVVAEAVKVAKIQPTQRHKTLAWLYDYLDPLNPEHTKHLDVIEGMSGKALSELKAVLQDREVSGFKVSSAGFTPLHVLFNELQRHAVIRPNLLEVRGCLLQLAPEHLIRFRAQTVLNPDELQSLFDVLHGKEVSEVLEVFTEAVANKHSVFEDGERVPAYAPIKFTIPARTVEPVVKVLETFTSFADELDGEIPVTVPVLIHQDWWFALDHTVEHPF